MHVYVAGNKLALIIITEKNPIFIPYFAGVDAVWGYIFLTRFEEIL